MKKKVNQLKAGVVLSYASMAIKNIIALAYTPIMLRLLGISQYGIYNLVASVVGYLGVLSFGFGSSYMRFYSRYKADKDEEGVARLNGMFLFVFIVIALIALAAGSILTMNTDSILSGGLTSQELKTAKILMSIMVFNVAMTFPASVFSSYVTAHERYIFLRIIDLLSSVLNPFLTLPLLFMGYKSISLVLASTFITLLSFSINIWYCFKKLKMKFTFNHFRFGLLKEIWIFSFFIFINMIVDQINWNVDKFILAKYKSSGEIAVYSIGSQFNTYYISFSAVISSVFIPRINRIVAESNDNNVLTGLFTRIGRVQFIVLSFIVSAFIFFGEYFIKIWAGKGYAGTYTTAYQVALWLMIPVTIPLIQNLGIEIQRAKNLHKFRSVIYLLIAVLNVLISIVLCQPYGGVGCAIGTAIALIVGNGFLMNWYYQTRVKLNIFYFWKRIVCFIPSLVAPCALGFIIKNIIHIDSILKFIGFGLLYFMVFILSMWYLGMNKYERNLIKGLFKKIRNNFFRRHEAVL